MQTILNGITAHLNISRNVFELQRNSLYFKFIIHHYIHGGFFSNISIWIKNEIVLIIINFSSSSNCSY